ncbi:hypothetical protein RvY_17832 [Ramazzottius varieornatus]|uniref:ER membrane protein complex subunit 7 beta-sandwich domain-containing protein n=1 Tax=Ramazzottius varieornatus TaxID=947166 RepID=A0A1D1W3K6_RAMVA|nr:hypothetical protein RvY_17832 [Ramazzottius varieornatus]
MDLLHLLLSLTVVTGTNFFSSAQNVPAKDPSPSASSSDSDLYAVEGKLVYVKSHDTKFIDGVRTKIALDGGEYFGFLNEDRESFTVYGVPPGSYLVEVYHPEFLFEAARVDISSKGKIRARRDGSEGGAGQNQLAYPLRLKLQRKATYFQAKEAMRITDMLMNPMVLMMVLPLLVMIGIPKLLSQVDPEASREMQSTLNMASQPMDLSSMMSQLLGGGAPPPKAIQSRKPERRERKRSA